MQTVTDRAESAAQAGKERSMNTLWVIVDAMRRTVEQPKGEHVPYRAPGQQPKSARLRTRLEELEAENATLRREVTALREALSQRSPSPLSR